MYTILLASYETRHSKADWPYSTVEIMCCGKRPGSPQEATNMLSTKTEGLVSWLPYTLRARSGYFILRIFFCLGAFVLVAVLLVHYCCNVCTAVASAVNNGRRIDTLLAAIDVKGWNTGTTILTEEAGVFDRSPNSPQQIVSQTYFLFPSSFTRCRRIRLN